MLTAIGAVALAVAAALAPSAAVAAFPGGNGRIAYTSSERTSSSDFPPTGHGGLFTIRPDGSGVRQLTSFNPFFSSDNLPSWSADGRRLAFNRVVDARTSCPTCKPGSDLFTIEPDGAETWIYGGPYFDTWPTNPSFSPNGRRIVYDDDYGAIFTVGTDGGAVPEKVLDWKGPVGAFDPEYSPSGRRIVFSSTPPNKGDAGIWSMRRDGSHPRRLTRTPDRIVCSRIIRGRGCCS